MSNHVRLFPVNSGILFVTEPLLGLMCRRPIQRECFSDRWCLEQLPISSDEDFVCTYVLYFWYVEKTNKQTKEEGEDLRGISEGGGGGSMEPKAETVNVLNSQI